MSMNANAPKNVTWFICLILFAVALLAHFRVAHISADIATWSWILGYALLLIAVRVKGL